MKIYFLIFFAILGAINCGHHEHMLAFLFKYRSITCEGNQCSFLFDIHNETYISWKTVMIRVSLGHTDKIDDGKIEVYDFYSGEPILNPRNVFQGSILSLQRNSTRTISCSSGSCIYDVCVARGRTEIIKQFDENYNPTTNIQWEPLITFNDLMNGNGIGPRLKFSYSIEKGLVSKLQVSSKVNFWGECDKPQLAYPDDEAIEVPVRYIN